MIESLDETIKQLLIQKMPLNQSEVDISFEAPDREWSGAISKPTINIYLHDIRENLEQRYAGYSAERNIVEGTYTITKTPGKFDISYLITVWTTNVEDEHRLLWYVMATMLKYPTLPREILQDPLQNQPIPIDTKCAQPDGILRNIADVWTALDNQLKPVLPYVVTLVMDPLFTREAPEVRSRFLNFLPPTSDIPALNRERVDELRREPPTLDKVLQPRVGSVQFVQVGGYIKDATDTGKAVIAEVILLEQGLNVKTNPEGRYTFQNVVKRPQYTFLVVAEGYKTTRKTISIPSADYDISLEPDPELAKK